MRSTYKGNMAYYIAFIPTIELDYIDSKMLSAASTSQMINISK